MGAGASTAAAKGKGKAKAGPGAAKAIEKAIESEEEAKALFGKIDANGDGKLSAEEIVESVKKHGKDVKANWPDALISEVVTFFDRDGDGMLDMDDFIAVLAELKARGGR